jgi:hypothetical protein
MEPAAKTDKIANVAPAVAIDRSTSRRVGRMESGVA